MLPRKAYIVLGLLLLMVVGFLATSFTSYHVANESISEQLSEQMLPLTSDNIYTEIQRDLLRPILISSVMASDTFVRDWILDGEENPQRITAYLTEIQREYDTITSYLVSDDSHTYYHSSGILKQVSAEDPADDWYFRVREMNQPYEINVDRDTADRNRLSIFINYRVLDYDGDYIGSTGVGLSLESVTQTLDAYEQRYGRTIYFTDRQGNITLTSQGNAALFNQNLRDRPDLAPQVNRLISMPSNSLAYRTAEGEQVFLNSRLVPEFNWYLIVEQEGSVQSERMRRTLWTNLAIALAIMTAVLAAAWMLMRSYQQRLEEMATTDRLTGVSNRHVFEPVAEHILKSTQRRERPVSLLLFDIDSFKAINDTHGHNIGDQVLKAAADIIQAHVRTTDTLCRWGGEEFMLLMDECTREEAAERASTICEAVRQYRMPLGKDNLSITLSCGVAEYKKGEQFRYLVSRVDTALYRAKEEGRDQVVLV